jgi:alkylhydroperoxidase/carboxymuconolactone decarboxylase family protein YurZ
MPMHEPASETPTTPVMDWMRADGSFNPAWKDAAALDPMWMERFLAMGTMPFTSGVLDPKTLELIAIAVDASCTHLYAPGVRRHIARALEIGVTPAEILAVLQAVSVLGIHSMALGAPILAEEMRARGLPFPPADTEDANALPR